MFWALVRYRKYCAADSVAEAAVLRAHCWHDAGDIVVVGFADAGAGKGTALRTVWFAWGTGT